MMNHYSTVQYQEELVELNTAAHQRPHLDLIANIQQENRQLRALESENKELKSALEEHQNTLELIMSKYRQQISRLLEANHAEKSLSKLLPDTRVINNTRYYSQILLLSKQ